MKHQSSQSGFILMIVVMLAFLIGLTVIAMKRISSSRSDPIDDASSLIQSQN